MFWAEKTIEFEANVLISVYLRCHTGTVVKVLIFLLENGLEKTCLYIVLSLDEWDLTVLYINTN